MEYTGDVDQVPENLYQYPDPEEAQNSLWPTNVAPSDVTHGGTWHTALQAISPHIEELYPSLEEEEEEEKGDHDELDPNAHFGALSKTGKAIDSDYFDEDKDESDQYSKVLSIMTLG